MEKQGKVNFLIVGKRYALEINEVNDFFTNLCERTASMLDRRIKKKEIEGTTLIRLSDIESKFIPILYLGDVLFGESDDPSKYDQLRDKLRQTEGNLRDSTPDELLTIMRNIFDQGSLFTFFNSYKTLPQYTEIKPISKRTMALIPSQQENDDFKVSAMIEIFYPEEYGDYFLLIKGDLGITGLDFGENIADSLYNFNSIRLAIPQGIECLTNKPNLAQLNTHSRNTIKVVDSILDGISVMSSKVQLLKDDVLTPAEEEDDGSEIKGFESEDEDEGTCY